MSAAPPQLPIAPLREALTKAGFKNATTYINSGNALVRTALSREETIAKVAAICKKKFGFDKAIFAPTTAGWQAVIKNNPFPRRWPHRSGFTRPYSRTRLQQQRSKPCSHLPWRVNN